MIICFLFVTDGMLSHVSHFSAKHLIGPDAKTSFDVKAEPDLPIIEIVTSNVDESSKMVASIVINPTVADEQGIGADKVLHCFALYYISCCFTVFHCVSFYCIIREIRIASNHHFSSSSSSSSST